METLAAYDATGSFRAAGDLAGCSHHTVKKYVTARDTGTPVPSTAPRTKTTDAYQKHIDQYVTDSKGSIRADEANEWLQRLGYTGSERSTRRAVNLAKRAWRAVNQRVHTPWVTEPGRWLQYDFGDGPVIDGVKTILFVAWLAWSRYRIVIPLRDKSMPSVFAAIDQGFRIIGGAPTYVLTDNEKTVTAMHIAGIPVRNKQAVTFAKYYSVSLLTCEPADPASKGRVENAVKVAKADLVPKDTNLREEYESFAQLVQACDEFMTMVNDRVHRTTRRQPSVMLAEERTALHALPAEPFTIAFGLSRTVPLKTPMVSFENAQYSVPCQLLGQQVWVRSRGMNKSAEVVIVHLGTDGATEVARHPQGSAGVLRVTGEHFPVREEKIPGVKRPKARS